MVYQRKRSSWSVRPYIPVLQQAGRYAGRQLIKAGAKRLASRAFSRSSTRSSKRQHTEAPITGDVDQRIVYQRKRFPKHRKKRWVQFKKKVRHIQFKDIKPHFAVFAYGVDDLSLDGKQFALSSFTVLGFHGHNEEANDVGRLWGLVPTAGSVGASVPAVVDSSSIRVTGYNAECVLRNDNNHAMYVECYYWRCIRDCPLDAISNPVHNKTVVNLWRQGLENLNANFPVGGSTLDFEDYGCSPFHSPLFSHYIRVYRKTRILMGALGTTQIGLRSGKDMKFTYDKNEHLLAKKGITNGVLFVWYGVPGNMSNISTSSRLRVSVNKSFTYRVTVPNFSSAGHDNL